mmetsp:Transcript_44379/g.100111  ORF Transcript_44379/g.100111 Transcript_44379/m.100111 type:complete len:243 (-) Transcript_44379:266-994(-)
MHHRRRKPSQPPGPGGLLPWSGESKQAGGCLPRHRPQTGRPRARPCLPLGSAVLSGGPRRATRRPLWRSGRTRGWQSQGAERQTRGRTRGPASHGRTRGSGTLRLLAGRHPHDWWRSQFGAVPHLCRLLTRSLRRPRPLEAGPPWPPSGGRSQGAHSGHWCQRVATRRPRHQLKANRQAPTRPSYPFRPARPPRDPFFVRLPWFRAAALARAAPAQFGARPAARPRRWVHVAVGPRHRCEGR